MQTQAEGEAVDFTCLPREVWLRVMELLCTRDRYRLALTCSLFHQLFEHPSFWRHGFLDLTRVCRGQEGSVWLALRRRSRLTAERFGHFFQHLRFHVPNCHVAIDDSTWELLSSLSEMWKLKTLKLVVSSYGSRCSVYGRHTHDRLSCLHAAVKILRNAKDLRQLHLEQWPVTSDLLADGEQALGIERVLAETETCPQLSSLNITWKFNPCSANSVVQHCPQTAVDLVSKFRCLKHLSVRHVLLSESLLRELACGGGRGPLLSLTVTCESDAEEEGFDDASPEISEAAWTLLKGSCPQLEVRLTVKAADLQLIEWALKPHVPVSSVDLLAREGPLTEELLCPLKVWRDSLTALTVASSHRGLMPRLDDLLVDLVTTCTRLQHLTFIGKICDGTARRLMSLERRWVVLKFV